MNDEFCPVYTYGPFSVESEAENLINMAVIVFPILRSQGDFTPYSVLADECWMTVGATSTYSLEVSLRVIFIVTSPQ